MSLREIIRRDRPHLIGDSHPVEVASIEAVDRDCILGFRDLESPGATYFECFITAEIPGVAIGDRGVILRVASRVERSGRWSFTRDEGQGGASTDGRTEGPGEAPGTPRADDDAGLRPGDPGDD